MSVWWALAVVDRAAVLPDAGPDGARLAAAPLGHGLPSLVAAELPRLPSIDLDALRWHDAAVRALAAPGVALLPARFGAHAPDLMELAERLRGRERVLEDALDRVGDALQVTLRAGSAPALELAPDLDADAARGPGARFLLRRARERALRPPGWDALSAPLRPHLRAERFERGEARVESWRGYHLVERATLAAYRAASARVCEAEPGWNLSFGEPSPPYAFAAEIAS